MKKWAGRSASLTEDQAREVLRVKALADQVPKASELARRLGVSVNTVQRYLSGYVPKRHAHLLHDAQR